MICISQMRKQLSLAQDCRISRQMRKDLNLSSLAPEFVLWSTILHCLCDDQVYAAPLQTLCIRTYDFKLLNLNIYKCKKNVKQTEKIFTTHYDEAMNFKNANSWYTSLTSRWKEGRQTCKEIPMCTTSLIFKRYKLKQWWGVSFIYNIVKYWKV